MTEKYHQAPPQKLTGHKVKKIIRIIIYDFPKNQKNRPKKRLQKVFYYKSMLFYYQI